MYFMKKLLNRPEPQCATNPNRILPYTFVSDKAFAMRNDFIKPYRREGLNKERRIFNYRLSKARRMIENTLGILASRFRIFDTSINLKLKNIDIVVFACCALYNFLRISSNLYTS